MYCENCPCDSCVAQTLALKAELDAKHAAYERQIAQSQKKLDDIDQRTHNSRRLGQMIWMLSLDTKSTEELQKRTLRIAEALDTTTAEINFRRKKAAIELDRRSSNVAHEHRDEPWAQRLIAAGAVSSTRLVTPWSNAQREPEPKRCPRCGAFLSKKGRHSTTVGICK